MSNVDFVYVAEIIKELLDAKNQKDLADRLGISAQAVASAKKRNSVPAPWFEKVQILTGKTKDEVYRLAQERFSHPLAQLGAQLLWNADNEADPPPAHLAARQTLRLSWSPAENVEPAQLPDRDRAVPVISFVQAGNWATAVDNFQPGDAEEWVHCSARCGPRSFGLRVKGPSMEPEFWEEEIIIVDPDKEAVSGDFVVAKNGENEATFKRYLVEGGRHYLMPMNSKFDPMDMTGKDWRIVGRVMEKVKKY